MLLFLPLYQMASSTWCWTSSPNGWIPNMSYYLVTVLETAAHIQSRVTRMNQCKLTISHETLYQFLKPR